MKYCIGLKTERDFMRNNEPEKVFFKSRCCNLSTSGIKNNVVINDKASTRNISFQNNNKGCYSDLRSGKNNEVVKCNTTNHDLPMQSNLDHSLVEKKDHLEDLNKCEILENINNVKNCEMIQEEVNTPKVCTCNVCKGNNATNSENKPVELLNDGIIKKQKMPVSICCSVAINQKSNMSLCNTIHECELISKSQDMFQNKERLLSAITLEESREEFSSDEVTFAHKNDISEFKFFECFKNEAVDGNSNQSISLDIMKTVKKNTLIEDNINKYNGNKCVDKALKRNQEATQESSRIRIQEDENVDSRMTNQRKNISEMNIKQLKQKINSSTVNISKREFIEQKPKKGTDKNECLVTKISCENNSQTIEKETDILIISSSKKSFFEESKISKELSNQKDQLKIEDYSYTKINTVNDSNDDLNVSDKEEKFICTNTAGQLKKRMTFYIHSSKNSSIEDIVNSKESKQIQCFLKEPSSEILKTEDCFTRIRNDCAYDFKDKGRSFCKNRIEQLKLRMNALLVKRSKKKRNECVVKELSTDQLNADDYFNGIGTNNDWNADSKIPDKRDKYICTNKIEQLKQKMNTLLMNRSTKRFIENVNPKERCVVKELSRELINTDGYLHRVDTDNDQASKFKVPDKGKSYCKFNIEQLKQRMDSLNLRGISLNVNCPKHEGENRAGNNKKLDDNEHLRAEPKINRIAQKHNDNTEIVCCKKSSNDVVEVSKEQSHCHIEKCYRHNKGNKLVHKASCGAQVQSNLESTYFKVKKNKITDVKSRRKKSNEFFGEMSELEKIKRYQCKVDELYNQISKHVNLSPKVSKRSKKFSETGRKNSHKTHHSNKLDGGIWEKILEDDD